jgi:small subunit ribosomal protein S4
MTRIISSKYKKSRSMLVSIHGRESDAIKFRNYKPGQHGNAIGFTSKKSNFGVQLIEKQKIRFFHNMTEKSFRIFFDRAQKAKGNLSENFATLLALRLDTVVYLSNLVASYYQAQQLISHKHILINGRVVNIKSYILKVGDIISLSDSAKNFAFIKANIELNEKKELSHYISVKNFTITVNKSPSVADNIYPFQPNFRSIVEFYSK